MGLMDKFQKKKKESEPESEPLRPNMNDSVFTNQLTDTIREELEYDNDEYEYKQRKKRSSPGVK